MAAHPLFQQNPRTLGEARSFPEGADYVLHVFELIPKGYLVTHSDDRLPLVLAYSTHSPLSLEDLPENTLRAFLIEAATSAGEKLASIEKGEPLATEIQPLSGGGQSPDYPAGDFIVGPWLDSTWNQTDPYNYYAPTDVGSPFGYDGRVPIGCVPLAYAQLLYYHRWPLRGIGSSSYNDNLGSTTGTYSATFSDSYDWSNITNSHTPADSTAVQEAIGELVYELAVAVEADFESTGTSSSINFMRQQLVEHFQFEASDHYNSYATLQEALDQDILDGYPGIIGIPGHAVVADGLLRVGSELQYHINYGWGGTNNGWFAHDAIPGGGMTDGVVSLRPKHLAVPEADNYSIDEGEACEVYFTLPKRRNGEVDYIRILQEVTYPGPWSHPATNFDLTQNNSDWSITENGYSGNGWYAGPNGPAQIDLTTSFIPDASTNFQFRMQYRLGSAAFRILLSNDGGESYNVLQSWSNNSRLSWQLHSLPLAAYAGQEVRLRLELLSGSYYSNGGVWIDDLSVTSGSYKVWETLIENPTQELLEFSSTSTLWEDCDAFDLFLSTSTDSKYDWTLSTEAGIGEVFHKEAGGYSNREYHLTSNQTLFVPNAQTRLSLYMETDLANDGFEVLASTDGANFSSIGSVSGTSDWGNRTFDLSAYAGREVYIRLEYTIGAFFSGGGVWIDSISLEEFSNPQYEEQPMHRVTLAGLAPGDYTLAAQVVRTDGAPNSTGPAFSLSVMQSEVYTPQGTPYSWLIENGLAAEGASDAEMEAAAISDPTGKGNSAAFDYIAGTDPNDQADRLAFTNMNVGTSEVNLQWTGALGRWYQIWQSATLAPDSWNLLGTTECTTDNETLSLNFTPAGTTNFFKISVTIEEPSP